MLKFAYNKKYPTFAREFKKTRMRKFLFLSFVFIVFIGTTAFSFWKEKELSPLITQPDALYTVEPDNDANYIPGYGKTYLGFKEAIAFKESQGRYSIVNTLGFLGKYQFGKATLLTLRISNPDFFLYSAKLQERAFKANCSYNKWLLQKEIETYSGKLINGVRITESGILAAAHLAGAGSVKRFLKNGGKGRRIKDAYGTRIEHYFKDFSGYDLSSLTPMRIPKL